LQDRSIKVMELGKVVAQNPVSCLSVTQFVFGRDIQKSDIYRGFGLSVQSDIDSR
jgi:hypothetical protein